MLSKMLKSVQKFPKDRQNPLDFALDRKRTFGYNVDKCGNRLAVWRQLPKLILAGSTPVSRSIKTAPTNVGTVFILMSGKREHERS